MSDVVRILERGCELLWRGGRVWEALGGLDPDLVWSVLEVRCARLWRLRGGHTLPMVLLADPDEARAAAGP